MDAREIAIACQGGGIQEAFTCVVLTKILQTKIDEDDQPSHDIERRFKICGLSGTSAGALNAFMVWNGILTQGLRGCRGIGFPCFLGLLFLYRKCCIKTGVLLGLPVLEQV